jgi:hypothetical protein
LDYAIIPFFQTVLEGALLCVRMVYGKGGYGRSKNILLSECVCGIIYFELNGFQYFLRGMETGGTF